MPIVNFFPEITIILLYRKKTAKLEDCDKITHRFSSASAIAIYDAEGSEKQQVLYRKTDLLKKWLVCKLTLCWSELFFLAEGKVVRQHQYLNVGVGVGMAGLPLS